tara:strand:- start:372 stop:1139 length:768 start_codon:yes stop_codon:yes gene_type:complete
METNFINVKKFEKIIISGFFTSKGGVSKGNYLSLNCNSNSKDKKNDIKKNIKIAKTILKINNKKIKFINQIHSKKIFFINKKNYNNDFYGDGLITQEKNIALAVLTADCAPIFVFDIKKNIICNLHSGWKGALNNIARECVKKLQKKNISNRDLVAIVGPCLGFKNFEVSKNFKSKFIKKNKNYLQFFKSKNINKDIFNLRGLINFQLKEEGISKIHNINMDTYKNNDIFFSHRRASHENKNNTGRMINIICLKD